MLNEYLPQSILEGTLTKTGWNDISWILSGRGLTKSEILIRPSILGLLHHAAYLDKYSNAKFRLQLLKHAPRPLVERYLAEIGVKDDLSSFDSQQYEDLVKTVVLGSKWADNLETLKFVEIFGYPEYLIPGKVGGMPDMEIAKTAQGNSQHDTQYPAKNLEHLLEYQSTIFYQVSSELERYFFKCLIQMPTGSGKTRSALEILCNFLNSSAHDKRQVVWITYRQELLEQAIADFKHLWYHYGMIDIPIYRMYGNHSISSIPDGRAFVAIGYDKLNNVLKKSADIGLEPHLIIVDEAHQVLAPTYRRAIETLIDQNRKNGARLIGLSATPGRGFSELENKQLASFFNKVIITIPTGKEKNAIRCLQKQGVLAYYEKEELYTGFEFELTPKEWKYVTTMVKGQYPELPTPILRKMAEDRNRNRIIVNRLEELARQGKRILYFATSQEQSRFICAILLAMGIKAMHIEGNTNKGFRQDVVEKFKTGEINVLCNFNIFSYGIDIRKLDVVFIARPITSPVLYSQIVGRGMRGPKMGGKERFTLIQVKDKVKPNKFNFDPYRNYHSWDQFWDDTN